MSSPPKQNTSTFQHYVPGNDSQFGDTENIECSLKELIFIQWDKNRFFVLFCFNLTNDNNVFFFPLDVLVYNFETFAHL